MSASREGQSFADAAQALSAAEEHHRAGRLEDALACYSKLLEFTPDDADALFNRSQILLTLGRLEEALPGFDRVVALQPADAGALRARGVILQGLDRMAEALASYDGALALAPDDAEALTARGGVLHGLGRYEEALVSYERAQALKPGSALAHFNESLCRLVVGDYARGWEKYEWRWRWDGFSSPRLSFREPLWLGREDLAGKTILLHAEQGLGDTVQFARYAPLVAARGATVVLMVQKLLVPLMRRIAGPERVLGPGEPTPAAHFYAPLLSLPHAFGTTLESVPAKVPYLEFPAERVAQWRRKLGGEGKPLVGVCWRGSAGYKGDRERSIPFAAFAPLLAISGVRFIGLQKDLNADERLPAGADFLNPGEGFTETAELVAALDLVISVDTAWAHVAGAAGRPLWLLLPQVAHWCWLRERSDSPWYPTARLFRQRRRGDWSDAITEVAQALARLQG